MSKNNKTFLAIGTIALILEDESGKEFRVPQGEVFEFSEKQYKDVSAYVTLVEPDAETAQALEAAVETVPEAQSPPAEAKATEAKAAAKSGTKAVEQA